MPAARITARLLAALTLGLVSPARGAGPADPLLRLVPPDAGLTVAVEDLRGSAVAFSGSPLADELGKLPAVRDWLASDRSLRLRRGLRKVGEVLGEDPAAVRDGLFGEAVVLTLWIPPGGRPEGARGLLLVRVPDRAMLDRIVGGINVAQLKSGELRQIGDRDRGGTAYHVREFRGRRAPEFYATLDDRVFAWSNSEELIQGAVDRQKDGAGGLAGSPDFRRVRGRLPVRPAASLFVDPRFVGRLLAASPKPRKPDDERVAALLTRYLAAVRYAGAALEWRDGLVLHTEEVVSPDAIAPALKVWAARTDTPDPSSRRVPRTALVMATAHVDFGALVDGLSGLVPDRGRPKVENLRLSVNGLLLGLDARSEVLPALGPGALAYVERPEGDGPESRLPTVLSVEVS
ncbi:MAG: hypothetical protein LC745_11775, partial [Planctomycetia bacterium]|nr:hypothetical protein [Planctomycetia bacterium]